MTEKIRGILSLSYGKDSLACLGACEELGWKIERIFHVEIWATETIHADSQEMLDFKEKADLIIKERYGIEVEHIRANKTYEEVFYTKYKKGKWAGKIMGWPLTRGAWCNSRLKVDVLSKNQKGETCFIGIAKDEPNRFGTLSENKRSPLVEAGWDEEKCYKWCEENDLLSPIYYQSDRGGCWFCHNQSVQSLRELKNNNPEYWDIMMKWDKDSTRTFNSKGKTLHDYDKRFEIEKTGTIPTDRKFRWKMIDKQ